MDKTGQQKGVCVPQRVLAMLDDSMPVTPNDDEANKHE
jgi:hypothetical protein